MSTASNAVKPPPLTSTGSVGGDTAGATVTVTVDAACAAPIASINTAAASATRR